GRTGAQGPAPRIFPPLTYRGTHLPTNKRPPYEDRLAEGFSDKVLAERLKRQHRLICAAIHSGRIDDLKKMSGRGKEAPSKQELVETVATEEEQSAELEAAASTTVEEPFEIEYWPVTQEWTPPPPRTEPEEEAVPVEAEEEEQLYQPDEETALPDEAYEPEEETEPLVESVVDDGLAITMLDDDEFYSGQRYTLRVLISNRTAGKERPLANTAVSVKILGTTFRPLIYTLKTESDGVASITTEIPQFTSGRAAVLVRAVAKDQAAELRKIIHPAE